MRSDDELVERGNDGPFKELSWNLPEKTGVKSRNALTTIAANSLRHSACRLQKSKQKSLHHTICLDADNYKGNRK
jgi:hypothetical protein